jgi:hypothetical protein
VGPGGSITLPGADTFVYESGASVRLEATANPGFRFSHWSGSCPGPNNPKVITMDQDYDIRANFVSLLDTIHVDDNAPGDPAENGSVEHPFDQIQEAIEVAAKGASIIVYPGLYRETIDFLGKSIRLIGMEVNEPAGMAWPVIDGGGADTVVTFAGGEDANCMLVGFTITGGRAQSVGAIRCTASSPTIADCIIVGNRTTDPNGVAVLCRDSTAAFINCTIADNYACEYGSGMCLQNGRVVVANSIIWTTAPTGVIAKGGDPYIRYSDVKGGWPGRGNVDTDPVFAGTGCWVDRNRPDVVVSPAYPDAVWITGDYHLKSRAGRWDPATGTWVRDQTSSPCIDAGDPRSWVGDEPLPNGDIINMGAYGGTTQACKSYVWPRTRTWGRRH